MKVYEYDNLGKEEDGSFWGKMDRKIPLLAGEKGEKAPIALTIARQRDRIYIESIWAGLPVQG